MNEIDGVGCKKYRELRDALKATPDYLLFKDIIGFNLNPLIQNLTSLTNLTSYEDGLEFCHFVEDAHVDGYDFVNFTYSQELQDLCSKYFKSEAFSKLYGHKDMRLLKVSELTQLILTRLLTIPPQWQIDQDPILAQENAWLYKLHGFQMKFGAFNKISEHKFFMLMGESWNMKAFLSLVTDDFKWDYVPQSSMVLVEAYEEDVLNATTNATEVQGTIKVKYNDQEVKLKGRCMGLSECPVLDFVNTIRDQGLYISQEMR